MKQLLSLALALLPCFALAQYPSNGNQKITLGEQTTADGLIWRGVAATDTVRKPSIDTMAYMVLDTTTNIIWHYKKATSNAWLRLNLLPSDTASMLTNYYRSGRTGIIQASDVPTLNQNTTGSAATLTTSRTFQTNLASTSTASFNGSANVTPGVTGTLPVANGGTGATSFSPNFYLIRTNASGILDTSIIYESGGRVGINTNEPGTRLHVKGSGATTSISDIPTTLNTRMDMANPVISFGFGYLSNSDYPFMQSYNSGTVAPIRTAINPFGGDIGINLGDNNASERLDINGNVRIRAVGAGAYSNDLNITSTGVLTTASSSDETFKYNINPIAYGLETILQLKPVSFQWKKGDEHDLGFIAQDAVNIIPEAVDTFWDSSLLFRSNTIIPILTKAIQEQQALIKALEQRIINLENK